jgi:hypothetical protein
MGTRVDLEVRSWVAVDASVEWAFDVFTAGIADWWPRAAEPSRAAIGLRPRGTLHLERWEGGRLVERGSGEPVRWGTVARWDPPHLVAFEWLVGPQAPPTEVEVSFRPDGEHTRVELVHTGWELAAGWGLGVLTGDELRARFAGREGWERVLEHYAVAVGA